MRRWDSWPTSPESCCHEERSCSCLCLLTTINRIHLTSSSFSLPFFTYYSSSFPIIWQQRYCTFMGQYWTQRQSRIMKGNGPLPSKGAWSPCCLYRKSVTGKIVKTGKILLPGMFGTQTNATVRHCSLAWQTHPPADGIPSSFLPDTHQNNIKDACAQLKLSWLWSVCTAVFSS